MLILAAVLVLAGTAVLSALSRALIAVSPSQLERELEARGQLDRDRWLIERLERVEWSVAFLRTMGRIAFFSLVLVMVVGFEDPMTPWTLLLSAFIAGLLVWLFTGVVAGGFARHAPAEVIARTTWLLRMAYSALYPLVALAGAAEPLVRRIAGAPSERARQEEELLSSIEDTQRQGAIDKVSAAILENVMEFSDTTVGAIMTPRSAVKGIAYSDDLDAVRTAVEQAGFPRYPVYEGSLDNIAGILYAKDLMPYLGRPTPGFTLRPLLRAAMKVSESMPVRQLLQDFQRNKMVFAMVLDEYGGVTGLVTIEDVVEELVGEISDRHMRGGDALNVKRISPDSVEARGKVSVWELAEALNVELPQDEGFETVAGLLLARLGHFPKAGTVHETDGIKFEVLRATPTKVDLVRATKLPPTTQPGE